MLLKVAGDVSQLRQVAEPVDEAGNPRGEFLGVGVFKHEVIRRAAYRGIDGQILHRLHIQRDADNAGYFALDAPNDLGRRQVALVVGL